MKTSYLSGLVVGLVLLLTISARAQFSLGVVSSFPTGTWSNDFGTGFGMDGRWEGAIRKSSHFNWTASTGFSSFAAHSEAVSLPSINVIPANVGLKIYSNKTRGLYVGADVGVYYFSSSLGGTSSSKTVFGLAPGVGYRICKLDFSCRYSSAGDLSYFAFRGAYFFVNK